jgi:hypothetical protein
MKQKDKKQQKIRQALSGVCFTLLCVVMLCACNDHPDINPVYKYDLQTLPVPKKLAQGETAELRCTLVKEGEYSGTRYFLRWFQTDGHGVLKSEDGTTFLPNDLYPITQDVFRLYFTALSNEQQAFDLYIVDSWGQVVQKTFSFGSDNSGEEDEENEEQP